MRNLKMGKPKVIAIIQARMESTRLPGKVLLPLAGEPMLWWIAKRASLADSVDKVVIATTARSQNDPICIHEKQGIDRFHGAYIYRYSGEEDDLIGRVISAAETHGADIIIDLTADCPCIDPKHIDKLIRKLKTGLNSNLEHFDYVSNDIVDRSWPNGLDIQCYWTRTLQRCKVLFNPQKHCGWNIAQHPEIFNIYHWQAPSFDIKTGEHTMYWPALGLTLDTPEDYKLLKIIFDRFGHNPAFTAEGVVNFLAKNSELIEINWSVQRKVPEEG